MSSTSTADLTTKRLSKTKRCLFGPVDHDIVRKDLECMLKLETPTKMEWNYNFVKDMPLAHGRFEWSEVNVSEDYVPEFYRKGYVTRAPPTPRKVNQIQHKNTNSIAKKTTAVKQLSILFKDSVDKDVHSHCALSSISTSSSSNTTTKQPFVVNRIPPHKLNKKDTESSSQSHISDFMGVRKRRTDDVSSNIQRKLPRV